MTKLCDVSIDGGNAGLTKFEGVEYELLDFKASVYHKITIPIGNYGYKDGAVMYINDFGIRSILITPMGSKVMPI